MAVKKQWYQIQAPEMFGSKIIGETPAIDPRKISGRIIEVNLMELEKNYRRFFVKLRFMITENKDGTFLTDFIGHTTMNERVYKMVQRRTRRGDSIFTAETKDGKKVRLKVIFILERRVNTTIKKAARVAATELIKEAASKDSFENFMKDVISGKSGEDIKNDLSKIYPCTDAEVRMSEVLK